MNKKLLFFLIAFFYISQVSAMLKYEINLEEYLTGYIPIKSLILEGDCLQAEARLADGRCSIF